MSPRIPTRSWLALVLLLVGCSPTVTLKANDYDRTCSVDSDCVLVQVGEVCNSDGMVCSCNFGAVSKQGQEQHRADFEDTWCAFERKQCAPCPPGPEPICAGGSCTLR